MPRVEIKTTWEKLELVVWTEKTNACNTAENHSQCNYPAVLVHRMPLSNVYDSRKLVSSSLLGVNMQIPIFWCFLKSSRNQRETVFNRSIRESTLVYFSMRIFRFESTKPGRAWRMIWIFLSTARKTWLCFKRSNDISKITNTMKVWVLTWSGWGRCMPWIESEINYLSPRCIDGLIA